MVKKRMKSLDSMMVKVDVRDERERGKIARGRRR